MRRHFYHGMKTNDPCRMIGLYGNDRGRRGISSIQERVFSDPDPLCSHVDTHPGFVERTIFVIPSWELIVTAVCKQ